MAAIHKITAGPSQWDIMISLFQGEEVTFTLDNGTVVKVAIQAIAEHSHWDYVGDFGLPSPDYLLHGEYQAETDADYTVVYAWYSPVNRQGQMSLFDYAEGEHEVLAVEWRRRVLGQVTPTSK